LGGTAEIPKDAAEIIINEKEVQNVISGKTIAQGGEFENGILSLDGVTRFVCYVSLGQSIG